MTTRIKKKCKKGKHLNKRTNRCNKNKPKKKKKKATHTIRQKQSQKVIVHIHDKPKRKRRKPQPRTMNLKNYSMVQHMLLQPNPIHRNTAEREANKKIEILNAQLQEQKLRANELLNLKKILAENKSIRKNEAILQDELKDLQRRDDVRALQLRTLERVEPASRLKGHYKERLKTLLEMTRTDLRILYQSTIGKEAPKNATFKFMATQIINQEMIFG